MENLLLNRKILTVVLTVALCIGGIDVPIVDAAPVVVQDDSRTLEQGFFITQINDEIFARIKGKSFKDNCTLPREDLRYLHVLHKDLQGNTHDLQRLHCLRFTRYFSKALRGELPD